MKTISIILAIILSSGLAAGIFKSASVWENNKVSADKFEKISEATDVTIEKASKSHKFTVTAETEDGKEFPMFIEGVSRSGDNGNPRSQKGDPIPIPGWEPKGSWGWHETVYIYASVEMKEDVNLKYITLNNEDETYVRRLELDKFFGTTHSFKKGEKYGVAIPL